MTDAAFLALSTAAATAYLALAGRPERSRDLPDGVLDVAAIALAACVPIYGARQADEPLRRLTDGEVAAGHFARGASCLRPTGGGPDFIRLSVTPADFAAALARLKQAGVNFSEARFEPGPRRAPRIAPGLNLA